MRNTSHSSSFPPIQYFSHSSLSFIGGRNGLNGSCSYSDQFVISREWHIDSVSPHHFVWQSIPSSAAHTQLKHWIFDLLIHSPIRVFQQLLFITISIIISISYILSFHFQFPDSACNNAHIHGGPKYDHLLTAVHL